MTYREKALDCLKRHATNTDPEAFHVEADQLIEEGLLMILNDAPAKDVAAIAFILSKVELERWYA